MANPFYQQKDFRTEKLSSLKGMMSDRRANRVFNRYMKSGEGQKAADDFAKAESQKYMASVDAFLEAGKQRREGMHQAALQNINASLSSRVPVTKAPYPAPDLQQKAPLVIPKQIDWNAKAQQYGFADTEAVKQWQQQNGLTADGKFGQKSLSKWNSQQNSPQALTENKDTLINTGSLLETQPSVAEQVVQKPTAVKTNPFNIHQFAQRNGLKVVNQNGQNIVRWDPSGFGDFWVDSAGNIYDGGRVFDNTRKFSNSAGLGYGERKNRYEALQAAISGQAETGDSGVKIVEKRPTSTAYTNPPYRALYRKQGGIMNRINYFQQGGTAPQKDIKAQVTALVQAAMQGDQKATQQVNQIMEAAKAGNQQAVQLAKMITEVAKQLQGQATAAKWGAKLNYIQSLKFAKGGKTCPACEKKVERKACGGKKAKKHQVGGFLSSKTYPAEKYGYTTQEQIPTRKGNVLVSDPDNTPRRVILENTRRMPNGTFVNDTLYFRNAADQQRALSPKYGMSNPDQLRYKFGAVDYFGNTKVNPNKAAFESYLK